MKKQNFVICAVLAVIMMTLCSCENELAVALNGAWKNDGSNELVSEVITFTKTKSNGGQLKEKFVVEDYDYDGTRYGFEVVMDGEWYVEDENLFVSFDENSIQTKKYHSETIEELDEALKETVSLCRANARGFNQSYRQKIYVHGFHMNSDTHFSWITEDEGEESVESFTKM